MPLLAKKIAVVTGGGRGLGAEICYGLAAEGAHVLVVDKDSEAAVEVVEAISKSGGTASPEILDISDRDAVNNFGKRTIDKYGSIDVLVNNAGISPRVSLDDPNLSDWWDKIIGINLSGQWDLTIALLPGLQKPETSIIFVASIAAFTAPRSSAAYGAAKFGVRSLVQYFAKELGPKGVRVNGLAPGRMKTAMTEGSEGTPGHQRFLERVPLGRSGEASELAGPAVFLASSMSSFITGVTIPVDGGFLAV